MSAQQSVVGNERHAASANAGDQLLTNTDYQIGVASANVDDKLGTLLIMTALPPDGRRHQRAPPGARFRARQEDRAGA